MVGDSNVVMAPFFGNKHGTCSIEVLTTENVKKEDWLPFCQSVLDKWAEYKDRNGQYLNIRPHWAKEWQGLKVRARPVRLCPVLSSTHRVLPTQPRSSRSLEVDVCAQSARLVSMQVRGRQSIPSNGPIPGRLPYWSRQEHTSESGVVPC